ncbi:MAG TPA: hypothetical protein VMD74_02245 [Candidatus Methylomirabilis sp.]|nr:hypothetical protein [Candidatus Methylomirabilis sp.]
MEYGKKIFYFSLAGICLTAIFGAIIYYFYALNWPGILLTLIFSGAGLYFFWRMLSAQKSVSPAANIFANINWKVIALTSVRLLPYFILLLFTFYFLLAAQTDAALTSPWQAVSHNFFIAYFLATAYLIWLIKKNSRFTLWLIVIHYFLSFSVLWIVFKIGYGYDPFIHQTTVDLIDKQGAVVPKTFYYLGQYSLVLVAHKIFFLPIAWADKLLVPILAALALPPTIYLFLKKYFQNLSFIIYNLSLLFLLFLPFSIFTLTVPQNLAYLFLLLSILIALTGEKPTLVTAGLLALASFAVHPLAGIPAALFVLALINEKIFSGAKKKIIKIIFIFIAALGVPLALFIASAGQNQAAATAPVVVNLKNIFWGFARQENIFLNFAHLFSYYQFIWLPLLAILAAIFIFRRQKNSGLTLTLWFSLALIVSWILTKLFVNFNFLISYERDQYLDRILTETFIFLIPAIVLGLTAFLKRLNETRPFIKFSWLLFLAVLVTTSLYCSYPLKNNYTNARSFSVGADDFAAVNWIEKDAGGKPYVVLSDQQVSAAALKTFGFSRYFKTPSSYQGEGGGEVYFYPIPTGGPLYQIYLDMVYQRPDRATARRAADLTGAGKVYFVINNYWTDFDKIVENAKIEASSYQNLNNGEIYIFTFK